MKVLIMNTSRGCSGSRNGIRI